MESSQAITDVIGPKNPIVFISHASEDKTRFVEPFSRMLRSKGIDAWLDKWEMLPGQKLAEKIFEEGIKRAQAIIIVLSPISVAKPWVREELNAAMVKKINENTKLIPVIIEDCELPECIKGLCWVRIQNLNNYDEEMDSIIRAIFNHTDKPPLGEIPEYIAQVSVSIQGLDKADQAVLITACEKVLSQPHMHVDTNEIIDSIKALEISEEALKESLEILHNKGYIDVTFHSLINIAPHFRVTDYGFSIYAANCIQDFQEKRQSIISKLVNEQQWVNHDIAQQTGIPQILVDFILDILVAEGMIRINKLGGFFTHVFYVSPELKRML